MQQFDSAVESCVPTAQLLFQYPITSCAPVAGTTINLKVIIIVVEIGSTPNSLVSTAGFNVNFVKR